MGTIITTVEFKKPLILTPKLGLLRELRNDHQLAIVREFRKCIHECISTGIGAQWTFPDADLRHRRPSRRADKKLLDIFSQDISFDVNRLTD